MSQKNIVLELSFSFALGVIQYCELLEKDRKYVISRQLLKAGTSIGASIREAQNAESMADFCHKIKIASKEAEETEYWLLLCHSSANYPIPVNLLDEIISIKKLLGKIVSTAKKRTPR